MRYLLILIFINSAFLSNAAGVDTVSIYSSSMKKSYKCVVIKPTSYKKKSNRFPVVYLLHGYGGDFANWIKRVPELTELANQNQTIIVCPEGTAGSWYFDSPIDSSMRFETYVGKEIPAFIDAKYRTIADRKHRAITGLSMGGHGALFLAFRHAEDFGACGSMSGALDIGKITRGYDMQKRLGDTIKNQKYYRDWAVVNAIEKYPKDSLAIIIDCGTEDFIYQMSKATHDKMMKLKIPHDYIERPGKHDWSYWGNAIKYQLLFFRHYFNKAPKA
ncbi:MAG TPA: alpha/beta hydrolase family protein [Segetibacter sp.]|jgi:S-formylglutathione hydrolase FrmB